MYELDDGLRRRQAVQHVLSDSLLFDSRDELPQDETITSYGKRLMSLTEANIIRQGGAKVTVEGKPAYRIPGEKAANVEPLLASAKQHAGLRAQLRGKIEKGIAAPGAQEKARAAYLAICFDFAPELKQQRSAQWTTAVKALAGYPRVLQAMADGRSPEEITEQLGVSRHTLRTHTQNILTKLGVHSKTDAVVAAIRFGKATPPGRAPSDRDALEAAGESGLERVV